MANIWLPALLKIPIEDIFGIVGSVLLKVWSISPKTSFNEPDLGFLVSLQLYCKPNITLMVQFIDEFDKRPSLYEFITHFILDMRE